MQLVHETFAATLGRALIRRGFPAVVLHDGEQALRAASVTPFDYVTIDLHLVQDSGLQWIKPLRTALPQARILVLTGYARIATAVQAVKLGADDYLGNPANLDTILAALGFESSLPGECLVPLSVDRLEWEHIQPVLAEHHGNVSATARAEHASTNLATSSPNGRCESSFGRAWGRWETAIETDFCQSSVQLHHEYIIAKQRYTP